MIHKPLLALALFVTGVALGSPLLNSVQPHAAAAQSMGSMMNGTHLSAADIQMMQAMKTMQMQMQRIKLTGNTDRDFMMMMIPHHGSAIAMAQIELKYGKSDKVKDLARSIIASQRKEIGQMKTWLSGSF